MANDYLKKHKTTEEACKAMLRNQIAKCTTSGILTGFGGFITMPVAIPANLWKCNLCADAYDCLCCIYGRL